MRYLIVIGNRNKFEHINRGSATKMNDAPVYSDPSPFAVWYSETEVRVRVEDQTSNRFEPVVVEPRCAIVLQQWCQCNH